MNSEEDRKVGRMELTEFWSHIVRDVGELCDDDQPVPAHKVSQEYKGHLMEIFWHVKIAWLTQILCPTTSAQCMKSEGRRKWHVM